MDGSSIDSSSDATEIDLAERFKELVGIAVEAASEVVYREARRLSRRDPAAAKDLAQDVWEHICRLLRNDRLTEHIERPEPWLRALVLTQLLQNLRRAATLKRGGHFDIEPLKARHERPTDVEGPDSIAVSADLHRRLRAAVADLPVDLRSVVTLILRGHTHPEIGEILGIPANTSKTRLRTALKLLRGSERLAAN